MAKKKVTYAFGADLSELEKGWKRIDYKLGKLSSSLQKTGRAMTTAFTVPLAAIGAAATKSALDVDKAMNAIARGTGATGAALKGLQTEWKSLAGSVSQNFETSAQVLADYNTRLGLTGKALKDLSKQALDAGRMLGEDVNTVVAESAKAMQDWGVDAGDMSAHMDKIFIASQSTGVGMAELSSNMYKYGSALRQMGFSTNDTIATLAKFNREGVNTELVMGSLRIALGNLAKAGVTDAAEGFRILTEQIKNAKSPTEATRKAIELFGSRAGPDMAAAIREGRFEIGELSAALLQSQGAIERNSAATKTFGDRWLETKNQVGIAIAPIGKQLLNLADSVMPSVKAQAEKLGTAIENMSEDSRKAIIALAASFAVGGPLLIAISATLNSVRTLGTALLAFATGPAAPLIATAAAVWAIVEAFKELNDMMSKTSEIQKRVTGMTPEQVMNRQRYREMAGEIYRERHGKYPVTAPDFKELDSIVDELLAEARKRMQQQIDMKGYTPRTEVGATPTPATGGTTSTAAEIEALLAAMSGAGEKAGGAAKKAKQEFSDLAVTLSKALGISAAEAEKRIEASKAIGERTADEIKALKERNAAMEESKNIAAELNQTFASEDAARSLEALRMQLDIGNIGLEQYREALTKIREQFAMFPGAVEQIDSAMRALDTSILASTKTLGAFINEAQTALRDKLTELPDKISDAFASAIVYGEDLGETLKRLAQDIAAAAIKAILLKTIFGGGGLGSLFGFSEGAAIQGGKVIPFAKGGIVSRPTIFPMAKGAGLMGEAGPEAIMPLKRGADGSLGVQSEGGGGTHITMNITAVDSRSFVEMMRTNRASVESIVVENIMKNGAVRGAIRGMA